MNSSNQIKTIASDPKQTLHRDTFGRHYVGKWELVNCLGAGEWSTVYSGRPRECSGNWPADYAIKIAERTGDKAGQAKQLLAREATIGRTVSHPHLVAVLSAHLDTNPAAMVMPLLQGVTLDLAVAAHAPFSTPHALWIARQVTEALSELHGAGWMHADVKPGNIHVSPAGHATLIDLGFALKLNSHECSAGGSMRGSPAYTAPEMISSAVPVDGRCDIYSLGITLFELLTGAPPFPEREPGPLMLAHMQRPAPNPRFKVPTLDRDVGDLLQDMLSKEPLRRPSASELVSRLVDLEIATLQERGA